MIKNIPNLISVLNLCCGTIAVFFAAEGEFAIASWLIIAAAILDFFDGFAARMLNAVSDFGKQIDSLSDLISFGLAPAVILFGLLKSAFIIEELNIDETSYFDLIILFSPFLIVVFSAIRLAIFNIAENQKKEFRGVPTPANALLIASLPLILTYQPTLESMFVIINYYTLLSIIIIQSALMVIPFKVLSLKFNGWGLKQNILRYILIAHGIGFIIGFGFKGIPLLYFIYLILSLLLYIPFFGKKYEKK